MMEKIYNFKIKKRIHFLKFFFIHFVNVEIDPRLRYIFLALHKRNATRGCVTLWLAIYIKKDLKAKEELWKLKYFTMQKYNLQKNPLKGILYR